MWRGSRGFRSRSSPGLICLILPNLPLPLPPLLPSSIIYEIGSLLPIRRLLAVPTLLGLDRLSPPHHPQLSRLVALRSVPQPLTQVWSWIGHCRCNPLGRWIPVGGVRGPAEVQLQVESTPQGDHRRYRDMGTFTSLPIDHVADDSRGAGRATAVIPTSSARSSSGGLSGSCASSPQSHAPPPPTHDRLSMDPSCRPSSSVVRPALIQPEVTTDASDSPPVLRVRSPSR